MLISLLSISILADSNDPFTQCINGRCTTYYPAVIEHEKMLAEQRRLQIEKERLALEKEEYYKKYPEERPLSPAQLKAKKKAEYKAKRTEANRKAREKNRQRREEFDKKYSTTVPRHSSGDPIISKNREFDADKYKDTPQLIIGGKHLYDVSEVRMFKNNKVFVKSANGSYAFPLEIYESSEKINFSGDLQN